MDVGWGGVAFIWTGFLWPVLVTVVYVIWKRAAILRKGLFFVASVVAGYLAMLMGSLLSYILVRSVISIEDLERGDIPNENLIHVFVVLGALLYFMLPVLSTHFLSRKLSRTAENNAVKTPMSEPPV